MRVRTRGRLPAIVCAALLAGAGSVGVSGYAFAGSRLHEYVYSDSFGNLIVQSPYGYKRIIVGEGRLARKLSSYDGGREPKVVYGDPQGDYDHHGYYYDTCC